MSSVEQEQIKRAERKRRRRDIIIFGALAVTGAAILAPFLTQTNVSIWSLALPSLARKPSH